MAWELVLVNDGSRDASAQRLDEVAAGDVRHRRRTCGATDGQTAALMAGLDHARARSSCRWTATCRTIPTTSAACWTSWPRLRRCLWLAKGPPGPRHQRNLPSRIANGLIRGVGRALHDYGCSLKAYRRDVLDGVKLYGEMHRFVPIMPVGTVRALPRCRCATTRVCTESPSMGSSASSGDARPHRCEILFRYSNKPIRVLAVSVSSPWPA